MQEVISPGAAFFNEELNHSIELIAADSEPVM